MFGLNWITGGKPKPRVDARRVRAVAAQMARRMVARYDSAQNGEEDRRYWSLVDNMSADAAMSPEVRRAVRNKARYEGANGGYANGMVKQKANDLIGTGPRLQMLGGDEGRNALLESEWVQWMRKTRFARTLRTASRCKVRDGAALGLIGHDSKLPTKAKVKLRLVEIDRLHTPDLTPLEPGRVDGIDFDAEGDPAWYWILDVHPGAQQFTGMPTATRYPASAVVHWYDEDRAEQHHGLSEMQPSLRLFGQQRRFLRATLRAIEVAAEIAAFMTTDEPADDEDEPEEGEGKAFDVLDLEFGGIMVAPEGRDIKQIKSEHPNTQFAEVVDQTVCETGRPLLMPKNIAGGSSAGYNYASGRLDNQKYDGANTIDRDDLEIIIVDPVADQWLRETLAEMSGIAPSDIDLSDYPHEWHWDQQGHVDPAKEANAQDTDLRNGSLTFPTLYAQQGKDWRKEFQKQAEALGVTLAEFQAMVRKALYETAARTAAQPVGDSDARDAAELADAENE